MAHNRLYKKFYPMALLK